VLFRIANQGNVLEHPKGSVTIRNESGAVVEILPYTMDTFLPHTSIDYPLTLKKALPAGNYTASVTVAYGGGQTTSAKPAFEVTKQNVQQVFTSSSPTKAPPSSSASGANGKKSSNSWLWIAIAIAAVLLVAGGFLLFRRRRPAAASVTCDPYHHWIVDHDAPVTGADGIVRYPHRCRDCGLQVVAKDISEATDFAAAMKRS
jgi:LPXTG-motif cell wall-anchored protein